MVMALIGVLLTLTIAVVGGMVTSARQAATEATLSKIQGLLNSRSQAFMRLTMRKGFIDGTPELKLVQSWNNANFTSAQNPLGIPSNLQRILALKLLQRRYFPQMLTELNPVYMQNVGIVTQPNLQNVTAASSSAILYDFLTQEFLVGDAPPGNDMFTAAEVKMNTTTNLNEFVDAWGNPLRFYRWPTRLFRSQGQSSPTALNFITTATGPNPTSANPDGSYDVVNAQILFSTLPIFTGNLQMDLSRDPDDPLRDCLATFGSFTNLNFETAQVTGAAPGPCFHTPVTFHVFLIVSAGPDGQLGLFEPDDVANNGHLAQPIPNQEDALADNIVSLSIKAGGAR